MTEPARRTSTTPTAPIPAQPGPDEVARAKTRARADWARLRDRLATVTPAAVGRAGLGVVVVLAIVAAVAGTWPALLPFAVGGLLAYAVMPVVDGLDRVMPRPLAAGIAMLAALGVIVGTLVVVIPPLVGATIALAASLPDAPHMTQAVDDLLTGLPDSAREVVRPVALSILDAVTHGLDEASSGLDQIVPVAFQAILGVVGAFLGLLVLPTWMLSVMSDRHHGSAAFDREVAGWLRPDLWAVVRMADRAAGTYLRGFVVVAFVVGALIWVGLLASPRLGGPTYQGPLAVAVFAGASQLIPELGPILGLAPAVFMLAVDPPRAAVFVAVYFVARFLTSKLVGRRFGDEQLHVHPAVLVPGVVILGQFGLLPLLLSGPIIAFSADVVRYLHGRFSEPPRPAGLLPGEPPPVPVVPLTRRVRVRRPGSVASWTTATSASAPTTATPSRTPETSEVPA